VHVIYCRLIILDGKVPFFEVCRLDLESFLSEVASLTTSKRLRCSDVAIYSSIKDSDGNLARSDLLYV
jgi:hypothetical protein